MTRKNPFILVFFLLLCLPVVASWNVAWYEAETNTRISSEYRGGFGSEVYAAIIPSENNVSFTATLTTPEGSTAFTSDFEGVNTPVSTPSFTLSSYDPYVLSLSVGEQEFFSRSVRAVNTPPFVTDVRLLSVENPSVNCVDGHCLLSVSVRDDACEELGVSVEAEVLLSQQGSEPVFVEATGFSRVSGCVYRSVPLLLREQALSGSVVASASITVTDDRGSLVSDSRSFLLSLPVSESVSGVDSCPLFSSVDEVVVSGSRLSFDVPLSSVRDDVVVVPSLRVADSFGVLPGDWSFDRREFVLSGGGQSVFSARYVPVVGEELFDSRYSLSFLVSDAVSGGVLCELVVPVVVRSPASLSSGIGGGGALLSGGAGGFPLWVLALFAVLMFCLFFLLWLR